MNLKKGLIALSPMLVLMAWLSFKKVMQAPRTPPLAPLAPLEAACIMEGCSSDYQLASGKETIHLAAARCAAHDNFKRFECTDIKCTLQQRETVATLTAPIAIFDEAAQQLELPKQFTLQHDDLTTQGSAAVLDLKTLELTSSQPIKIENAQVIHAAHCYKIDLKNKTSLFEGGVTTVLTK